MSAENSSTGGDLTNEIRHRDPAPPSPALRLRELLEACSESFKAGDLAKSGDGVAAVIDLLNSLAETPPSDSDVAASDAKNPEEVLAELHCFISSPSNQMAVEYLSFELPKVVVKFASLSDWCRETVGDIIDRLVSVCSPRDMFSILCEALDTHIRASTTPAHFIPLFSGLSKAFPSIQRRHVEQLKMALPVIFKVLNCLSSEVDEEDKDSLTDLFSEATSVGTSVQAVCEMVETRKEELRAILGLYALQNIALISRSRQAHIDIVSSCCSLIVQFSKFLPFCGLSYLGLITGRDITSINLRASKGDFDVRDGNDFMTCLSSVKDGATLAVIWGYISDDVAKAAGEQMTTVLNEIQKDRIKRWQAIDMLKPILSSIDYPWDMKNHSIDLLLSMMDGSNSEESSDNDIDFSSFMPSHFVTLEAIERIMIGASDASLRKKAFAALRQVVSDIPSSYRFDILEALITQSNIPSMIAILIDLVRVEILKEEQKNLPACDELIQGQGRAPISSFLSSHALDLVELILKPPKGGPPSLPEYSEPVLSALNLFRFILIIASRGKENQAAVYSENTLRKAYSEWLLPLRTLVSGIQAENEKDHSELAEHVICSINPLQLVLYRCIELVEDQLKHCK